MRAAGAHVERIGAGAAGARSFPRSDSLRPAALPVVTARLGPPHFRNARRPSRRTAQAAGHAAGRMEEDVVQAHEEHAHPEEPQRGHEAGPVLPIAATAEVKVPEMPEEDQRHVLQVVDRVVDEVFDPGASLLDVEKVEAINDSDDEVPQHLLDLATRTFAEVRALHHHQREHDEHVEGKQDEDPLAVNRNKERDGEDARSEDEKMPEVEEDEAGPAEALLVRARAAQSRLVAHKGPGQ